MAAPAYGDRGTYLIGASSTTANVPRPTGTAAGNHVFVFLYMESEDEPTPPAAFPFNQIIPPPQIPDGEDGAHTLRAFWRVAGASEPTTYNFTGLVAPWRSAVAIRVTGADPTDPVDVFDTGVTTVPDTDGPILSLSTTGPERLLLSVRANFWGGSWAPITGFTERVDDGDAIGIGTRTLDTQGSSGNVQGVVTSPDPDQDYQSASLIALRSAAPPAQTVTLPAIPSAAVVYAPTLDQTPQITPEPIPAPPPPYEPTVVPGPVDVVLDPIPAPPAPFSPQLVHIIRLDPIPPPLPPFAPELVQAIRPPLRVDFWAVDDDGSLLCPLPHVLSWDISLIPGENGAVTLEYPRDGDQFDVLNERVTARRDLQIRIRTDGTHDNSLGAVLHARDGNEVTEGGTVTFYGRFLTALLDEAPIPHNPSDEKGEWAYPDGTAGSILADVLNTVQGDGYLLSSTWTFTDTHDSNGVPWSLQTSPQFPPGRTVLQIAQQLRQWGMVEFEVTTDHEVRAYEPGTVGTDHTLSDPPVVFRAGRDLLEAPHKADVAEAVTSLLIAGDEGVYVEVDDPTAVAERGRKIGRYVSEGNLTTAGAAQAYGALELARSTHGVDERTRALTFSQDQPVPLRELMPLDWVYDDTGQGLSAPLQIAQVTISQRAGEDTYSGGITLGDLIASRDVRVQRQLDGLAGGQIVTGTSTPSPDSDDGKAPAQVVGVAVDSAPYPDQDRTVAAVAVTWLPVTTNFDGSPMNDLGSYQVQYRYSGGDEGLPTDWVSVPAVTGDEFAAWDGVVAGVEISVRVRAVDRYNHAGDWSVEEPHLTQSDTTPPPVLPAPNGRSYVGILVFPWNGLGAAGEPMPSDFLEAQLHMSLSAGFTPDLPRDADGRIDTAASTTYRDRLTGPGELPVDVGGDYDVTWYSAWVAVDRSNNASAASATGSVVREQIPDGSIEEVNIGKLRAGIMSALMTVSGIIRTAASGSRVELTTGGFKCYLGTVAVLNFDIPTAALSIVGKLTSGAGVGVGSTVVVDPAVPAIDMYPIATTTRIRQQASSFANPVTGGSVAGYTRQTLNTSGQTAGPFTQEWPDGVWRSFKTTAGVVQGGRLLLYSATSPEGSGAFIGYQDASTDSFINIGSNGALSLKGPFAANSTLAGQASMFVGFSSLGSGFSGVNISYGTTMADQRVILHSWQGSRAHTWLDAVSATGFTVLREHPDGGTYPAGWVHYCSYGTTL